MMNPMDAETLSRDKMQGLFDTMDADRDGYVTREEAERWLRANAREAAESIEPVISTFLQHLEHADADHDGRISRAEFTERYK